jgi:hypothetical protein
VRSGNSPRAPGVHSSSSSDIGSNQKLEPVTSRRPILAATLSAPGPSH